MVTGLVRVSMGLCGPSVAADVGACIGGGCAIIDKLKKCKWIGGVGRGVAYWAMPARGRLESGAIDWFKGDPGLAKRGGRIGRREKGRRLDRNAMMRGGKGRVRMGWEVEGWW